MYTCRFDSGYYLGVRLIRGRVGRRGLRLLESLVSSHLPRPKVKWTHLECTGTQWTVAEPGRLLNSSRTG